MNPAAPDCVDELGALLRDTHAAVRINRTRIAPSTLYDANYRLALIAIAFEFHGQGDRGLLSSWLKLLQFVAARPWLADDLLEWIGARKIADLATWRSFPRGYVGDKMHDSLVEYLIIAEVLRRSDESICLGPRGAYLHTLAVQIADLNLFENERRVLQQMTRVRPTKTLLRGEP